MQDFVAAEAVVAAVDCVAVYDILQHGQQEEDRGGGVEWLLITLRIKFYLKTIDVINFAVG